MNPVFLSNALQALLVCGITRYPKDVTALLLPHACMHAMSLQSSLTLCDSMGCSLPGSSVHGIPQVRILEWVAMPSSRGSSQPRDRTHVSYVSSIGRWVLYPECHLGSLIEYNSSPGIVFRTAIEFPGELEGCLQKGGSK